jgi:hypothetical protein
VDDFDGSGSLEMASSGLAIGAPASGQKVPRVDVVVVERQGALEPGAGRHLRERKKTLYNHAINRPATNPSTNAHTAPAMAPTKDGI